MSDNESTTVPRRSQRLAGVVGLLLAGGLAGGVLAATNSATAAGTTTPLPAATSAPTAPGATPAPGATTAPTAPGDRGFRTRPGETPLTGADAAKVRAAALKAVPGGTVDRVETDADGATYEAHMTKADGTRVTVKLDKTFKVTSIQSGRGACGPDGQRRPGGQDRTSGPADDTAQTAPTAFGAVV
jgi:hypothetical protein